MQSILRGKGKDEVPVGSAHELDLLSRSLDPKNLRLKKEIQLGGKQVWRGGRVVDPPSVTSIAGLKLIQVPGLVTLQYDDLQSTTMFDREGGKPRVFKAAASLHAPLGAASSLQGLQKNAIAEVPLGSLGSGICRWPRMFVRIVASCLAAGFYAMGHALENACGDGASPYTSLESLTSNQRSAKPKADAGGSA